MSKKIKDAWDVVMIMVTHVDDLAWSDTPESKEVIRCIKEKFPIDKEATGDFKFTGHEITQDEDFTVHIRCRDTTLKMGRVDYVTTKADNQSKATPDEYDQFRSVNGSLMSTRCVLPRQRVAAAREEASARGPEGVQ